MRKSYVPALVVCATLLATAAFAAGISATGVIKSVDKKGDAIILTDGKVYTLSEGFEAEKFKAGEKVAVIYDMKNGKMVATSVKIVK